MAFLHRVYAALRALLIVSVAGHGPASAQTADQEETEWRAALSAGTADAFQRYLERYPTGRYAEEAFGCAIEAGLCASDASAAVVTRGIDLDVY
jgi:hypothetical protein